MFGDVLLGHTLLGDALLGDVLLGHALLGDENLLIAIEAMPKACPYVMALWSVWFWRIWAV